MIELRQLRYFVAVANEQHVGQAATKLHISGSPLSRQIRQLEDYLGLALFERDKKRLKLTTTGRYLLAEAQALLTQAQMFERNARNCVLGEAGLVEIGYFQSAMYNPLLPSTLKRLRNEAPLIQTRLHLLRREDQINALHAGQLDIGFVNAKVDYRGIECKKIVSEPFTLLVPRGHKILRHKRFNPNLLSEAPWIAPPTSLSAHFRKTLIETLADAGISPNFTYEVVDIPAALALVKAGAGITLGPESMAQIVTGIRAVPLPFLKIHFEIHVIWRTKLISIAAKRILKLLRSNTVRI